MVCLLQCEVTTNKHGRLARVRVLSDMGQAEVDEEMEVEVGPAHPHSSSSYSSPPDNQIPFFHGKMFDVDFFFFPRCLYLFNYHH